MAEREARPPMLYFSHASFSVSFPISDLFTSAGVPAPLYPFHFDDQRLSGAENDGIASKLAFLVLSVSYTVGYQESAQMTTPKLPAEV
ncbi:hypothetical protein D3C80_1756200 [compost metagenome]